MATDIPPPVPLSAAELDEIEATWKQYGEAPDGSHRDQMIGRYLLDTHRLVAMARRTERLERLAYTSCCRSGSTEWHCIGCRRNSGEQHDNGCPVAALTPAQEETP